MLSDTCALTAATVWGAAHASAGHLLPRGAPGWALIYARLQNDPSDADAFAWLTRRVTRWVERQLLHPALRAYHEDVVAATCASVLICIEDAYGAETFSAFVYGHYLNARRG